MCVFSVSFSSVLFSFPYSRKLKLGWYLIFSRTALESGYLSLNLKVIILCPGVLDNVFDSSGPQFPNEYSEDNNPSVTSP